MTAPTSTYGIRDVVSPATTVSVHTNPKSLARLPVGTYAVVNGSDCWSASASTPEPTTTPVGRVLPGVVAAINLSAVSTVASPLLVTVTVASFGLGFEPVVVNTEPSHPPNDTLKVRGLSDVFVKVSKKLV